MNNQFKLRNCGEIKYLQCQSKELNQLTNHAFSTRCSGVSKIPYNTLNLSLSVCDDKKNVIENRKFFFDVFTIDYKKIVSTKQVHKDNIAIISREDEGKGALNYRDSIPGSDALLTNIPGVPLLMFYADCVPVFILDPVKKVIGLIHAGRNGTLLNLSFKTVVKMEENYGTKPDTCIAAIFPAIGSCCYHFDNQEIVADWLTDENIKNNIVLKNKENIIQIDLKKANFMQLKKAGLKTRNIFTSNECTADNLKCYFSHHRDKGKTGRMAALLMLKENR